MNYKPACLRPNPKHILFAIVLQFLPNLFSQNNGELMEESLELYPPFTVVQYSTKNGLPQNQVTEIISTDDGSVILATANGIVSFNGYEFNSFLGEKENKTYAFKKLYWNKNHRLLLGVSQDGYVCSVYPQYFQLNPAYTGQEPACNLHVNNDTVYLATRNGSFYKYILGENNLHKIGHSPTGITHSLVYTYPYLYAGTQQGLYRLHTQNQTGTILSDLPFFQLEVNPFGKKVYGTTLDKLFQIDSIPHEIYNIQPNNGQEICKDIEFADTNSIFLGSTKGMFLIEPEYPELFTKKSGLPSHNISSLYYNKNENCLFIGTDEKGLLKLQLKNCYSFTHKQGLSESATNSIIVTADKKVLAAQNCCAIYEVHPDSLYAYSSNKAHYACLAEINGVIYAGTWGKGVILLNNHTSMGSIQVPQLPDNKVHAVYEDSEGNIWIGTGNGIARGKDPKKIIPFATGTITGSILTFYELKNGMICMGGSNGVYIVKGNQVVRKIGTEDGLYAKEVRTLYEDKEGKIWIGTYGGGLYCFYKNKLTSINKMKGSMLDVDAFCLAPDDYGYLYIASNHGLWRVKENDANDFFYHRLNYLIPFHYDQENGIINPEFTGGFQNNYLRTPNHHFYFPTIEGLVQVLPDEPRFRKLIPSINRVFVNDTLSSLQNNIFKRNTHSIQFDFSCVNYLNKFNVYFQHKLIGEKNTEWSIPQKANSVNYKMLPPGKYTFMVRAIDGFNDREPFVTVFKFEIQPHFYETTFFRVLSFVFFVAFVAILILLRFYSIRKKAEKKELAKRQLAEFELKAIQAQMSPHFIFNCLNSIKYFVISGQNENAEKFLDHFSLLIRKFLETSEMVEVLLTEEVAMLHEYLSLEKMRLNNQMDFEINVDENCKKLSIPTMLTQPYVENAIKHGIGHLNTGGKIWVRFSYADRILRVEIEDNGIGRKKGMEISAATRKHIPKGMGLVQEKSELLQILYKKNIHIHVVDKMDGQKNPAGTLVLIQIPI